MSIGVGKTVCVTGASGYIASCLVKHLLLRGYTVKASVRDPSQFFIFLHCFWYQFIIFLVSWSRSHFHHIFHVFFFGFESHFDIFILIYFFLLISDVFSLFCLYVFLFFLSCDLRLCMQNKKYPFYSNVTFFMFWLHPFNEKWFQISGDSTVIIILLFGCRQKKWN